MIENIRCVFLHGKSGAGKTQTARKIIPPGRENPGVQEGSVLRMWDHEQLAAPLVALHSIKTDTVGNDSDNRQLWLIDDILGNLFPYATVPYDDLIELVYDIHAYPLVIGSNHDGQAVRDRNFMTYTADRCHELYPNIFADYLARKIQNNYRMLEKEHPEPLVEYNVLISDLRLRPELELFKSKFSDVTVIKLEVSEDIRANRLLERDGWALTNEQLAHPTQSSPFTEDEFDQIVNTDTLSLTDQASMIMQYLENPLTKAGV